MSWPRRFPSREQIAQRRECIVVMRDAGHTWAYCAAPFSITPQHAFLDYQRYKGKKDEAQRSN